MNSAALLWAACVCVLALGCGDNSRLPMAPVVGIVTFEGLPVAGAKVSFMATGAPRAATGETDAEGRFELTTFEQGDGAILGSHAVTVYKPKQDVQIAGPDPNLDRDAYLAAMDAAAKQAMESQDAGSALPAKYSSAETSDLRVDVVDGDNNVPILLAD
jgi:hypothetical protein